MRIASDMSMPVGTVVRVLTVQGVPSGAAAVEGGGQGRRCVMTRTCQQLSADVRLLAHPHTLSVGCVSLAVVTGHYVPVV